MDKLAFEAALKWLDDINLSTFSGCIKLIVIVGLVIWGFFMLVRAFVETSVKLLEFWKNAGLPTSFSRAKKLQIRKRQQLSLRLQSDLRTLDKAEHWNDQFFTDLEAEVEAEGRFYQSWWSRLFGRQSSGLRRTKSLIRAIETSAERTMLIVGEPGSGKSVAFRHLAIQLTEQSIRSSSRSVPVPLYVNLKELPQLPSCSIPDADFISRFVFDHIRRGDADLAESIQEHWKDYSERGLWFFLFDSFDEIPAVLHAPNESPVIQQHADAIRKFLDGIPNCRGCLASREYKGPEHLPWVKFRILLLSSERQEELIRNSALDVRGQHTVRKHLASQGGTHLHTPLFLTLLCRYVRRTGGPPTNDFSLLDDHLDLLVKRDEEYTRSRYDLNPRELLDAAQQLAVLFATEESLSLSPTLNAIASVWPSNHPLTAKLDKLLDALVYVKVGRADVPQAHRGDQQFTFAHRRYQETLFVRYLAQNQNHIAIPELIADRRWREYAVTLLQTQPIEALKTLLQEATVQLIQLSIDQRPTRILSEFGGHLGYYTWDDEDPVVHLLRLLQEGLARRLYELPAELSAAVASVLTPRWNEGDWHDRAKVLEVCSTLPQDILKKYILVAVEEGTQSMRQAAFHQLVALREIPAEIARWARKCIYREIFNAQNQVDLLKVDAMCSRLPDSVEASQTLAQTTTIRRITMFDMIGKRLHLQVEKRKQHIFWRRHPSSFYVFFIIWNIYISSGSLLLILGLKDILASMWNWIYVVIGLSLTGIGSWQLGVFCCLVTGDLLSWRAIKSNIFKALAAMYNSHSVRLVFIWYALAILVAWGLQMFGWILYFPLSLLIVLNCGFVITASIKFIYLIFSTRKTRERILQLKLQSNTPSELLLLLTSKDDIYYCLNEMSQDLLPSNAHKRSFGRLLSHLDREKPENFPSRISNSPLFRVEDLQIWYIQRLLDARM